MYTRLQIERYGLPFRTFFANRIFERADGSLFIYGDDSEYTRRVSGKHKLYLIRDAVIDHQDAPVLDVNMTPDGSWKE